MFVCLFVFVLLFSFSLLLASGQSNSQERCGTTFSSEETFLLLIFQPRPCSKSQQESDTVGGPRLPTHSK